MILRRLRRRLSLTTAFGFAGVSEHKNLKVENITMKSHRTILLLVVVGLAVVLSACAPKGEEMPTAVLPAGMAYADGKEIFFVHTETSDADIAKLLSDMMSSPVLLVEGLADVPDSALADVYVFDNGLEGTGPLGFQADVFDNPPGTEGYSPLRRLNVVTWTAPDQAQLLKSEEEIMGALAADQVSIAQPGVVVNMPFVSWDGGQR
jgi:hypothetical protein